MLTLECGVLTLECGMLTLECGMLTLECGMLTLECGMLTLERWGMALYIFESAEALCLMACRCIHQATTLQTSQNLQTNLLGGGFTLPLPPPGRSGPLRLWSSWNALPPSDPFKKNL